MDMPAGYKKLRSMRFENADEVDILYCLDLMKEMAEALELTKKIEISGTMTDLAIKAEIYHASENILKKFYEWK